VEPRLICLIGAECTGKTSLAQTLAGQTGGVWVPEYLRDYCDAHGTPEQSAQHLILEAQVERESVALAAARQQSLPWVLCDTAPLLTAIYSEYYFHDASLYPQARILHRRYALSLHLAPDLPWAPDSRQRDGPHTSQPIDQLIYRELTGLGYLHVRIGGTGQARQCSAIQALQSLTG
jgi:nicotinamide riboside kinase